MTPWLAADGSPVDAPAAICASVLAGLARLGRTRLVAIDGPAGSGKTTLSAASVDRLAAAGYRGHTLHMDDFYEGWDGGMSDDCLARVDRQVLDPLSRGRTARWHRYDWEAGQFDGWCDVPECEVLVLEGCGSGAEPFARYLSLLVWVEVTAELRLKRGIERDGPEVEPLWRAWMRREDRHFAAHRTRDRAELRFAT